MTQNANILPVHLAVGNDELKRSQVLSRLRARLEQDDDLSFDCDEFDGETASGQAIVCACQTHPFMATKRLVLVKNAHKLKKSDQDALTAYAQAPHETSVLALSYEKLARTTKLYKAIAALGKTAVITCELPKGRELQQKVVAMAQSFDVSMNADAAACLISYVGNDTVYLNNEVQKISLMCADKSCITLQDVETYCTSTAEAKPWKFLEPFSQRNTRAALQWLESANTVSVYVLVNQCAQRLRELIGVKQLENDGEPQTRVLEELGLTAAESWKIKYHKKYAQNFSLPELTNALISLRTTEQALKSGANPNDAFRLWVCSVLAK